MRRASAGRLGTGLLAAALTLLPAFSPVAAAVDPPLEVPLPPWLTGGIDILGDIGVEPPLGTGDRRVLAYYQEREGVAQGGMEAQLLRQPFSWRAWIGHPLSSTRRPQRGGDLLQFQLGLFRFGKKEYQRAAVAFMDLLVRFEASPLRDRALFWLGESQYWSGEWEEARKTHSILLGEDPEPRIRRAVLQSLGWLSQRTGNLEDALGYYRRFLDDHSRSPATPLVISRIGEVLYRLGSFEAAAEQFRRATLDFEDFPDREKALYMWSDSLRSAGEYTRARAGYEDFLKSYPESQYSASALFGIGWCRAGEGAYQEAAAVFEGIVDSFPEGSLADESLLLAAWSHMRAGNFDEAFRVLGYHRRHYLQSPWKERRQFLEGVTRLRSGDHQGAARIFAALISEGEDPELRQHSRFMQGLVLVGEELFAEAAAHFEELAGEKGAEDPALLFAGWAAYQDGSYKSVETLLRRYIRIAPTAAAVAEGLYWVAEAQVAQRRYTEATLSYGKLLAVYPEGPRVPDALLALGKTYARQEKWRDASRNLSRLHEQFPEVSFHAEAALRLGESLIEEGRGHEALAVLDRLLGGEIFYRQAAKAHYLKGSAFMREERFTEAMVAYQTVTSRYAFSEFADEAQFRIAWISFQTEEFEKAVQEFARLLERFPESDLAPISQLKAADAYYRLRKYPEALAAYSAVKEGYPRSRYIPDAEYGIGLVELAAGDFESYVGRSRMFARNHPRNSLTPAVLSQLGRQFLLRKRYEEAAGVFAELLQNYPGEETVTDLLLQAARADRGLGSRREAFSKLREGLEVATAYYEADFLFELANLHLEEGDCPGALQEYQRILENHPRHPVAQYALFDSAGCHLKEGDPEAAMQAYRILTEEYPQSKLLSGTYYQWGSLALEQGKFEEAEEALRKIPAGASRDLEARAAYKLGRVLQKRGKNDEALEHFLASWKSDPEGVFGLRAAFGAAEMARTLGREEVAAPLYHSIIDAGGEDVIVELAREGLEALRKIRRDDPAPAPAR